MGFHLVSLSASVPTGTSAYTGLAPVRDNVLASSGTSGFLVPGGMKAIAAWAGSATLSRSRLVAPSLLRVSYPFIRPATTAATPGDNPNFQVLFDSPLVFKDNEVMGADAIHGAVGSETVRCLVWLSDGMEAPPPGSSFWVKYISSTAAVADTWTPISVAMDQLPEGKYVVVGMEHWSATAYAARLVFPNKIMRPGTLAISGGTSPASARTHASFYDGRFGVFGTFAAFTPPGIEVLATSTDASHEGYLRLVKL